MAMIDPVCGMTVDRATAAGRHTHAGQTYYFCSISCRDRFAADPERWLSPHAPPPAMPPAASSSAGQWTCPMHPEIVRPGPGACPICGMALEPLTVTAQEEDNPELRDMTQRFWISVALTVPLLAIAMGHMLPGMPTQRLIPRGRQPWIEL